MQSAMVRAGRTVLARVDIAGGDASQLHCIASSPGFAIEWTPRACKPGHVVVALRVIRTATTRTRLCLVRFRLGSSSAAASITVVDD